MHVDMKTEITEAICSVAKQFSNGARDPEWTKAIKIAIGDLGASHGYEVLAGGVPERNFDKEWLYDLTWYKAWSAGEEHGLRCAPLILESEWISDFENIRVDFEKLLVGKAEYKVMVFQAKTQDIAEQMRRLKQAIDNYQGCKTAETYILACLDIHKLKFSVETKLSAQQ